MSKEAHIKTDTTELPIVEAQSDAVEFVVEEQNMEEQAVDQELAITTVVPSFLPSFNAGTNTIGTALNAGQSAENDVVEFNPQVDRDSNTPHPSTGMPDPRGQVSEDVLQYAKRCMSLKFNS